jgi:hypothetical protein
MKYTIEQGGFMDVEFESHPSNDGNNSDRFTIKLRAEGQRIEFNGMEVAELSFDIIGNFELNEFLTAISGIKRFVS